MTFDSEFGRICGVKRRKPGFPLVSFAQHPETGKRIPLQSLAHSKQTFYIPN
jgi:hypothetical protein